jgi:hypothetical protein
VVCGTLRLLWNFFHASNLSLYVKNGEEDTKAEMTIVMIIIYKWQRT